MQEAREGRQGRQGSAVLLAELRAGQEPLDRLAQAAGGGADALEGGAAAEEAEDVAGGVVVLRDEARQEGGRLLLLLALGLLLGGGRRARGRGRGIGRGGPGGSGRDRLDIPIADGLVRANGRGGVVVVAAVLAAVIVAAVRHLCAPLDDGPLQLLQSGAHSAALPDLCQLGPQLGRRRDGAVEVAANLLQLLARLLDLLLPRLDLRLLLGLLFVKRQAFLRFPHAAAVGLLRIFPARDLLLEAHDLEEGLHRPLEERAEPRRHERCVWWKFVVRPENCVYHTAHIRWRAAVPRRGALMLLGAMEPFLLESMVRWVVRCVRPCVMVCWVCISWR